MANLITEHIDIWTAAQTPKINGGRGRGKNSNGQSPHGIKRLRELILELAVRGKLVPQNSEDEPASVLLEKIAEERARVIKEGQIKKQKKLPEVTEDEKPFELPVGWEWARIGDIGHDWGQKKPDDDFTYIEVSGIDSSVGVVRSPTILSASKAPSRARKIVKTGTVIYSTVRPYLKNICVIEQEYSPEPIASTAFAILHPYLHMPGKYFTAYLRSPIFVSYVESVQTGIAYPAINDKQFFGAVIPIPPLAEQHRIVAKVDELMALCDQLEQQQTDSNGAHQTLVETLLSTLTNAADQRDLAKAWQRIANHFDTLFTTEHSIYQLKQTILQLAVMGKLIPQDPNDLPAPVRASHADGPRPGTWFVYALECEDGSIYIGQAEDVLERWKQHATGRGAEWTRKHPPVRLVHWEEFNSLESAVMREKELKTGFGRKWLKRELAAGRTRQAGEPASVLLSKIAKEKARLIKEGKIKKQNSLTEISDDEKPFELPVGWEWIRLGSAGLGSTGKTPSTNNPKYYNGEIPFIGPGQILPEGDIAESDKTLTEKGCEHSVIAEPGDILMVCIGGSIGKNTIARSKVAFNQQINCIHPLYVDSTYLNAAINSPHFQTSLLDAATGSATPIINRSKWEELLVALPPLAEQHRIVARVDELMAICDTIKAQLNDVQTTQVLLADTIVEKAVV